MTATTYSRKLDSSGRIMLPVKLREQMGLVPGIEYFFFTHEENGRRFICIECPAQENEIEKAIRLLQENGIRVDGA